MTSMFGPHSQRVLALITCIQGLSADQVDRVTSAWKRSSPDGRAQAWTQLNQSATEDERYRILAAASLGCRWHVASVIRAPYAPAAERSRQTVELARRHG